MKNDNLFYLPLEGVESEHCALIVDKGLTQVSGVLEHKVELNNRRAVISTENALAVLPVAVDKIRDLGYDVSSVKETFPVTGMTCASCAISTESIIKSQPGVLSAEVNFASATVKVEYLPGVITPEQMKAAVQSIGYDLVTDAPEDGNEVIEKLEKERYKSLRKKTVLAGIFTLPVVIIGMFFMDIPYANYIMWLLSTPVIVWFGKLFFINAVKQAKHRSANMDTLVALSTGIAYVFSVFNTIFPEFWHSRGIHGHVYFEAAAVVISFILLGKMLEEKAKGNTSSALRKLMGLQPKTVTLTDEQGGEKEISVSMIQQGDTILVRPGDKIAVDGAVAGGSSRIDESMITGEPVPVKKERGSKVFAGTINQSGSFKMIAEKVGKDTLLSQIIKAVQDAQGSKAPVQKLVDKVAAVFVPVVIVIAILSFISWIVLGGENGFTQGLLAMVTVLVIACPCALGLATPTAIMVGVGKAAENGILIRDAESLETALKIDAVVLDKTGTITEGRPSVTDAVWFDKGDMNDHILASLESRSEHPLAVEITRFLKAHHRIEITGFESITGFGVSGVYDGKTYYAGNHKLMKKVGINPGEEAGVKFDIWSSQAKSVVFFSDNKNVLGMFAVTDVIKPTSKEAIKNLKSRNIEVWMLTGDNRGTAAYVARETGVTGYKAEALPSDKALFIKELQSRGKVVAMVGDGINDSNALAEADVSIAMGKGSDIAMDVAKMTIISSDLMKIPRAITLSGKIVATVKQNLFWAFIYNIIGIPVAAGILYPFTGFLLDPMIAGAAMALSSVSVVTNSLKLKLTKM
ncbi:MAG: heavy metal translocating P-type ATPase [Ignavibacteriaceae bacterium]|nr:heavy metal translocating P-type ATPase [Ignavibacteriaceae bacterium]